MYVILVLLGHPLFRAWLAAPKPAAAASEASQSFEPWGTSSVPEEPTRYKTRVKLLTGRWLACCDWPSHCEERLFSVNYFGLLATIILAGSGATWTGVESMVMA